MLIPWWIWLIFSVLFILVFILGFYISRMKEQSKLISLEEKLNYSKEKIEELEQEAQTEDMEWMEKENQWKSLENQLENENRNLQNALTEEKTAHKYAIKKLEEQKHEIEKLHEVTRKEFENLANKILDEKADKFTETNKKELDTILNPFKLAMKDFKSKVEENTLNSAGQYGALKQQLESLQQMNQKIGLEAENLSKALKGDSKMQGDWGEMLLDKLMENTSLVENENYFKQETYQTEEGRKRTDVRILLPNDRNIIIDSKVSLTAYTQFFNETEDSKKEQFIKQHLLSIRNHIKNLSYTNYPQIPVNTLDFTILFMPVESAYITAVQKDPGLFKEAFDKHIVLASPSTLLAMLKTIDNLWQRENQNQNVLEIAKKASDLYDKFTGLLEDVTKIQNQYQTLGKTIENAEKKLKGKGNLVTQVEKIRKLGLSTKKQIGNDWLDTEED